jgi:alcohol dehydrogenase YqhD (iron-dependent ADH family)
MNSFDLHIPTHIYFGNDKLRDFTDHLKNFGNHVLIVTGGGSVKRLGYFDQVTDHLKNSGFTITHFDGIEPNPHSVTINKAAKLGKVQNVDFVLAFGGGSVMDASKAIAGLIHEGETDIWPFVLGESKYKTMKGALPVATIPTTAATASEITAHAVISNPDVKGKAPLSYPFLKPSTSWLNPNFHTSLPLETTRDGASDIISHVIENYLLGGNDSPIADRYSESIMETVMETLPMVEKNPQDPDLRGRLLWASTLALNGMQIAGRKPAPFTLHNLEHSLSGYRPELAHGRGLATLYPAYLRWLYENDRVRDRIALFGRRLFNISEEDDAEAARLAISAFENWLRENGLYQSLSDTGIPQEAFGEIADYAIKTYGGGKELSAAGPISRDQIIEIFQKTESQAEKHPETAALPQS